MGGGIAGWLTPGWMQYDSKLAPHVQTPGYIKTKLEAGEDPKADVIRDECKPQCTYWKDKLERCEKSLEVVIKVNPGKSCMYPMRDYVTCVEACAQPMIHNQLVGTH